VIAVVADTHTAIWYLFADRRLSSRARDAIEQAAAAGRQVGVSAITLAEIVYLTEKKRIAADTFRRLLSTLQDPRGPFVELPVDSGVVSSMAMVPRDQVADLPDRIIAATALRLGVPVISRDRKISGAELRTIW